MSTVNNKTLQSVHTHTSVSSHLIFFFFNLATTNERVGLICYSPHLQYFETLSWGRVNFQNTAAMQILKQVAPCRNNCLQTLTFCRPALRGENKGVAEACWSSFRCQHGKALCWYWSLATMERISDVGVKGSQQVKAKTTWIKPWPTTHTNW